MILEGVRVLEFTHVLAGPYCGRLLSDLGADVLKVDRPPQEAGAHTSGSPQNNAGKRSIAIDLASEAGLATARELAMWADVVIENFAPGALDRLGLGYESLSELNPRLIYASISGFGQDGEQSSRRAFGASAHAEAGFLWVQQQAHGHDEPLAPGIQVADILAAQNTLAGVMGALFHRERTGRGLRIDVTLMESQMAMMTEVVGRFLDSDEGDEWIPPRHPIYRSADGRSFTIHTGGPHNWARLAEGLGHPEAGGTPPADPLPILQEWIGVMEAAEVSQRLRETGAPFGLVQTLREAVTHPMFEERGLFVEVAGPTGGTMRTVGVPIRMDGEGFGPKGPSPLAGQHSRVVLREVLGHSDSEIDGLLASGAVVVSTQTVPR